MAVALVFSGLLGWERESVGKPAGLRTHMLVGAGAAMFVALGEMLVIELKPFGELQRFDPTRIIEAVAAGVSFLDAGTIFFARGEHRVHGFTTAASLWATAAIGMAVGLGRFVLAGGATLILFAVVRCFGWREKTGRADEE